MRTFTGVALVLFMVAEAFASSIDAISSERHRSAFSLLHMVQKDGMKKRPNISARIVALIQAAEQYPRSTAAVVADEMGFMSDDGKTVLFAEAADALALVKRSLIDRKADIRYTYGNTIEFRIAAADIAGLSNIAGVRMIREPDTPLLHIIEGEEVTNTRATNAHRAQYHGSGIKVAIIDGGFIGLNAAQAAGEVPSGIAVDFTGIGMETATDHGTAVAEVVHEMAPAAQLYFLKISTSVQLGNAKDYCIANGINIINHSMGWVNSEWGDGSGTICGIANDAYAHGILWVNSAGNSAQRHWQGMFSDGNANRRHNFSGAIEMNLIGYVSAGTPLAVYLCWNDPWSGSANDYDLHLVRSNNGAWSSVASSEGWQSGTQSPTEYISGTVGISDHYAVIISNYSAVLKEMQLFSFYQNFGYSNSTKSLMAPSDASGALAVGAVSFARWTSGPTAIYSSQGPSQDGRRKPDIVGVDSNANWTYGNFTGTSSASPCVAGAAAVIWGAYLGYYNNALTWNHLTNDAVDMGAPGIDDEYGYGRLSITIPVKGIPGVPTPALEYSPTTNIEFSWAKGGVNNTPIDYTVEISTNKVDTLSLTNTTSLSLPFTTVLTYPYTYYARVRGSNEFGLGSWSAWSTIGSLVDVSPPAFSGFSGSPTATNGTLFGLGISGTNDAGSGIDRIGLIVTNGTVPVIAAYQIPVNGIAVPGFVSLSTNIGVFLLDRVGNSSTTQYTSVGNVDAAPPVIRAPSRICDGRARHRFSASDAALVSFSYRVNGGALVPYTASPYTNELAAEIEFSRLGTNSVLLTAVDLAGNTTLSNVEFVAVRPDLGFSTIPNPYRGEGDMLFVNMTAGSSVKIYTISGRFLRSVPESLLTAVWDGRDMNGKAVPPGIYIALLVRADGSSVSTKVMVSRPRH